MNHRDAEAQSGKAAIKRGGETAEYSKNGINHGNTVYFQYSAYFAVATVPGCSRPTTSSNEEPMQCWSKMDHFSGAKLLFCFNRHRPVL
jgi:hypothetical protein